MEKWQKWLWYVLMMGLMLQPLVAWSAQHNTVFEDSKGHWSEGAISYCAGYGFMMAYSDGLFHPNGLVGLGEFVDVLCSIWGCAIRGRTANPLDEEKMALSEFHVRPNTIAQRPLLRIDVARILYKMLKLGGNGDVCLLKSFSDVDDLCEEDQAMVAAVIAKGLLRGYPDGTLGLSRTVTRAEMATLIKRTVGAFYPLPWTYGPDTYRATIDPDTKMIRGNATMSVAGVTLQNLHILGDLHLTEGLGMGEVVLKDIMVEGRTLISGGNITINGEGTDLGHVLVHSTMDDMVYLHLTETTGSKTFVLRTPVHLLAPLGQCMQFEIVVDPLPNAYTPTGQYRDFIFSGCFHNLKLPATLPPDVRIIRDLSCTQP